MAQSPANNSPILTSGKLDAFQKAVVGWQYNPNKIVQNVTTPSGDSMPVQQSEVMSALNTLGFSEKPDAPDFWTKANGFLKDQVTKQATYEQSQFSSAPRDVEAGSPTLERIENQVSQEKSEALERVKNQATRHGPEPATVSPSLGRDIPVFNRVSQSTQDKSGHSKDSPTSSSQSDYVKSENAVIQNRAAQEKAAGAKGLNDYKHPSVAFGAIGGSIRNYFRQMLGSPSNYLPAGEGDESESGETFTGPPVIVSNGGGGLRQAGSRASQVFFRQRQAAETVKTVKNVASVAKTGEQVVEVAAASTGVVALAVIAKKAITAVLTNSELRNKLQDALVKGGLMLNAAWVWLLGNPLVLSGLVLGGGVGFFLTPFFGPAAIAAGAGTGAAIGYALQSAFSTIGTSVSALTSGGALATSVSLTASTAMLSLISVGGFISFGAIIAIPSIINAAFIASPQQEDHGRDAVLTVQKFADPSAVPNYNPTSTTPTTISYKITVKAGDNAITVNSITDHLTCQNKDGTCRGIDGSELIMPPVNLTPQTAQIPANGSLDWNYTIQIVGAAYKDVYLVNAATVKATEAGSGKSEEQVASVAVPIGNPPAQQPYNWPVAGSTTSFDLAFGYKPIAGKTHNSFFRVGLSKPSYVDGGVDIAGNSGQDVHSTSAGTVLMAKWFFEPGGGCNNTGGTVYVQSGPYIVEYLHLDQSVEALDPTSPANIGKTVQVARGQVIGKVFTAALDPCTSTGPHVHYQIALTSGGNVFFGDPANAGSCKAGKIVAQTHSGGQTISPDEVANGTCN